MIDIHAHILPMLDDGAPDMESALAMAEIAVESGVTKIVATPHSNMPGRFENYWSPRLESAFERFRRELQTSGIDLTVLSGMEVFGTPDAPQLLRAGKLTTLGGSRYLLIEFPFERYGRQATQILGTLLSMNYRPVIAHPERYLYVQDNPELLNRWVQNGCLLQLNKGSIQGRFGRSAQALALSMLDRGLAAVVASDAHSDMVRTTWMRDIWYFLCEEYSESTAHLLLEENPRRILQDLDIHLQDPEWF